MVVRRFQLSMPAKAPSTSRHLASPIKYPITPHSEEVVIEGPPPNGAKRVATLDFRQWNVFVFAHVGSPSAWVSSE